MSPILAQMSPQLGSPNRMERMQLVALPDGKQATLARYGEPSLSLACIREVPQHPLDAAADADEIQALLLPQQQQQLPTPAADPEHPTCLPTPQQLAHPVKS
mmetsp:Transcript_2715/g.7672  ORF Transcript_2715/g.7672 Transcript_2715/m.7672 type:complete len:102 (+) Transcript_2715:1066-1371(+)